MANLKKPVFRGYHFTAALLRHFKIPPHHQFPNYVRSRGRNLGGNGELVNTFCLPNATMTPTPLAQVMPELVC